jgi:two-component system, OmpR family, response regulator QseB
MKLLFVEDDAMNRRVVKDMLDVAGVLMDEADGAQEGLRMIDGGDYDLILMDLRMPGMDGMEAIAALRQRADEKGRLPVIVLTADAAAGLRERCMAAGADEVLFKPVSMQSLFDAIAIVLVDRDGADTIVS